jgi:DnaJ-class molecular chaperone
VRGKGLPRRDGTRGDHIVPVVVAVPQQISDVASEELASNHQSQHDDPRAHLSKLVSAHD